MNTFSYIDRLRMLNDLKEQTFDLVIVGGGITGAGIALDAASRGLKVAVVEMQDFAAGTSSRSTRLIHGGLRYLKQLEFKLVAEVAKERQIIYRNAPHLVKPEPILLPITKTGSFGRVTTRLAMKVYEFLAAVDKNERHRYLTADETFSLEPLLNRGELLGGILYYEYRTDDARLTLSVIKQAVLRGTVAISYMKVTGFVYVGGKIKGVQALDCMEQETHEIKASFVVNASGPWVDELDGLDQSARTGKLQLTKGVHLVVDHGKLPLMQAVYFDTDDGRMVFTLPHRGKTYVGTTDTFYNGNKVNPEVTNDDKNYLLNCVNNYFSYKALTHEDIESCWAGIRPLIKKTGKNPSEISRKDEIFEWDSGLISIAGGKLSGYRKMAERIVDLIVKKLPTSLREQMQPCTTDKIHLGERSHGRSSVSKPVNEQMDAGLELGLNKKEVENLISQYGSGTEGIFELIKARGIRQNCADLPLIILAKLLYAIEYEMCLSPSDFFARRSGMLYFERNAVLQFKKPVLQKMQEILKWNEGQTKRHEQDLDLLLALSR